MHMIGESTVLLFYKEIVQDIKYSIERITEYEKIISSII